MPRRTSIITMSIVVAIMFVLSAVTQAVASGSLGDGTCDPSEAAKFQCFEDAGYVIEILPCNGVFPCNVAGDSIFNYKITRKDGRKILLVDVLVGVCKPAPLMIKVSDPYGKLFTDGKGGPVTDFGQGLTLDDTWWWNYIGYSGSISLTFKGQVPAVHKPMFFKTMSLLDKYGYGEILGPGCEPERPLVGIVVPNECINLVEMKTGGDVMNMAVGEGDEVERISASVRRDNNNCIIEDSVIFYNSSDCTGEIISHEFEDPEPGFIYKSGIGGGCPELVEVTANSPACVTLTLKSGRKTKVCE